MSLQKWNLRYTLGTVAELYPTLLVLRRKGRDCHSTSSADLSTPAKRTRIIYFLFKLAKGPARFRGVRLTNK